MNLFKSKLIFWDYHFVLTTDLVTWQTVVHNVETVVVELKNKLSELQIVEVIKHTLFYGLTCKMHGYFA